MEGGAGHYGRRGMHNRTYLPDHGRSRERIPSRVAPGTHALAPALRKNKKSRCGQTAAAIKEYTRGYFVTRSSQRTIESMTSIDMPQAATKTHHVAHIGVCM